MSQYPQPPYLGGLPGFAHTNPYGQPPNPLDEGAPADPTPGISLGPIVSLETIQEGLSPMFAVTQETFELVKGVAKGVADLNVQLDAIEARIKALSVDEGEDGDDEGGPTSEKNHLFQCN